MIQKTGRPITFVFWFTSTKKGKGGLAPSVKVVAPDGTLAVAAGVAAAWNTNVPGLYIYTLTTPTLTGGYAAVATTTDTTVDMQDVPSLWEIGIAGVDNLDIPNSAALFGAGTDVLIDPNALGGGS